MSFVFENLTEDVRSLMVDEINSDIRDGKLYISKRLNSRGTEIWGELLLKAARSGNEVTLNADISEGDYFNQTETSKSRSGDLISKKVPVDASITLSEGEFNRFYIRAVCVSAIRNSKNVVAYRAKEVSNPRSESIGKIGKIYDPNEVLVSLRSGKFVDDSLGIPPGPNSGLSVKSAS